MAQNKKSSIFGNIAYSIQEIIEGGKNGHIIRIITVSVCAFLAATFIFLGYRWYYVSKQEVAQKALAEAIAEYKTMAQGEQKDWDRMQMLFKVGAEQQSGSSLAPYFLAYQADSLLHGGKKEEALAVMNSVVDALSAKSPLYSLFKTKRAMMRLDAQDEAIREKGVAELIELGRNDQNIYKDMALYQLGNYYWSMQKKSDAIQVWQDLIDQYQYDLVSPSPWAQLAQQKMNKLIV